MTVPRETSRRLDDILGLLEREQTIELELQELAHLLTERDDPSSASTRAGIDVVAATLTSSRKLPERLTVRVRLPARTPGASVADITGAFHRRATEQATDAWRDAMTVRSMGRQQLPIGITIAVLSALLAYGIGAWATSVESALATGVLVVCSGLAITITWVVSWIVIETSMLDWRQDGRLAAAYELIAQSVLEVTDGAL
jgi:hypothetical protein